ncbi:LPXTG cell wall anchor domain-containing protein, partial [Klebsiella pneumoniae]
TDTPTPTETPSPTATETPTESSTPEPTATETTPPDDDDDLPDTGAGMNTLAGLGLGLFGAAAGAFVLSRRANQAG